MKNLYPDASHLRVKRLWDSLRGIASVDEQTYVLTQNRLERSSKRDERPVLAISWSILSRIETKSAAYLQHISMMIAAIGLLLAGFAESNFEKAILVIELIGYLVLALGCIRCLYHIPGLEMTGYQPHKATEEFWNDREEMIYISEVAFREYTLDFCTQWLWRLTIVFAITVFAHIAIGSTGVTQ
ncbi:hypothetical protein [Aliiroseovarius crassostreae]|uniref:hypothetical protein n=1 Tax=Aliiroseovarius crassostreae TaxID=154981 RepID=UPI003C7BE848